MKKRKVGTLRFAEKEMRTSLGQGNFIFLGSATDMWSEAVPSEWIVRALEYCKKFNNQYFFQSKSPARFEEFLDRLPPQSILCTTVETNREHRFSEAPSTIDRLETMLKLRKDGHSYPLHITIEPVMDFDVEEFARWIEAIRPEQVNIGANTNNDVQLPEPSRDKLMEFADTIAPYTDIHWKKNINRLSDGRRLKED